MKDYYSFRAMEKRYALFCHCGTVIILTLIFMVVSCRKDGKNGGKGDCKPSIDYECRIPVGLIKNIVLNEKNGGKTASDAHAIYRQSHAEGWSGMMKFYVQTGTLDFTPESRQEWGISHKAREIGIAEARVLLMKLQLTMDEAEIKRLIQQHFENEEHSPTSGQVADPKDSLSPSQTSASSSRRSKD